MVFHASSSYLFLLFFSSLISPFLSFSLFSTCLSLFFYSTLTPQDAANITHAYQPLFCRGIVLSGIGTIQSHLNLVYVSAVIPSSSRFHVVYPEGMQSVYGAPVRKVRACGKGLYHPSSISYVDYVCRYQIHL